MIGVLGGMGPLATLDFFTKVIAATPATGDAEHVPLLIQSDPRIAPRPPAILSGALSPLPDLLVGRDRLIRAGAKALVMPCNTAHFWYFDLLKGCSVPFLSIVDASINELASFATSGAQVGIIATRATLEAKIFDAALESAGFKLLKPTEHAMTSLVLPSIEQVKAGNIQQGGQLVEQAVQALRSNGAGAVILACTEIPMALDAIQSGLRSVCIDTTAALARSCVAWWQLNKST